MSECSMHGFLQLLYLPKPFLFMSEYRTGHLPEGKLITGGYPRTPFGKKKKKRAVITNSMPVEVHVTQSDEGSDGYIGRYYVSSGTVFCTYCFRHQHGS